MPHTITTFRIIQYLFILSLLLLLLFVAQCTGPSESSQEQEIYQSTLTGSDTASIDLTGKAYLKLKCRNVKGLTEFTGQYLSFLPMQKQYINAVQVEKDTTLTFALAIQRPEIVDFYLLDYPNNPYKILLIPADTLHLTFDLSRADWERPKPAWRGKTAKACQYYYDKFQFFKGNPFYAKTPLGGSPLPLSEAAKQVDSITNLELRFLKQYEKQQQLPAWFTALEKNDLIYFAFSAKISAEGYRKYAQHRTEKIDSNYYNFIYHLPAHREDARFSTYYYEYLKGLSTWLAEKKYGTASLDTMPREGRIKIFTSYSLTIADSLLKGEIRDLFKVITLFDTPVRHQMFTWVTGLLRQSGPYQYKQYPRYLSQYIDSAVLDRNDAAPDFTLRDLQNQEVSLHQFKGKALLINFWATWCNPCLKRVPEEIKLVRAMNAKPFVLVNICMESPKEQWKKMVQQLQMPGIHLYAGGQQLSKLSKDYNVTGFPHYVLVNQASKVHQNNPLYSNDAMIREINRLVEMP